MKCIAHSCENNSNDHLPAGQEILFRLDNLLVQEVPVVLGDPEAHLDPKEVHNLIMNLSEQIFLMSINIALNPSIKNYYC